MQRYISSKIDDSAVLPTDLSGVTFAPCPPSISSAPSPTAQSDWIGKSSGFPSSFFETSQKIFRQMVRVYAHLYWNHFEDVYHLGLERSMNSCFSHFVLTATELNLLERKDLEPMQALVDLWAANGTIPMESRAWGYARAEVGERLLSLAGAVGPV